MGRPSIITDEIIDEIITRLTNGEAMKAICRDDHMPAYLTQLKWQARYPEFGNLVTRARMDGTHVLAEQCMEIADDPNITDNRQRHIMIDTRMKLISKWNAAIYGDKTQTDVISSDGSMSPQITINVQPVSAKED